MFRDLPAVGTWLATDSTQPLIERFGRAAVRDAMRTELGIVREARTRGETLQRPRRECRRSASYAHMPRPSFPSSTPPASSCTPISDARRSPREALDAIAAVARSCTLELDRERARAVTAARTRWQRSVPSPARRMASSSTTAPPLSSW